MLLLQIAPFAYVQDQCYPSVVQCYVSGTVTFFAIVCTAEKNGTGHVQTKMKTVSESSSELIRQ